MSFLVSNQAVEGDCDVVLKKVGGALTVTAFKCKTEGKTSWLHTDSHACSKDATQLSSYTQNLHVSFSDNIESTEDFCAGCPILLPLNDTMALDFVQTSLVTLNNMTENITYTLAEVGRVTSQVGSNMIYTVLIFFLQDWMHLRVLISVNPSRYLVSGCVWWAAL